MIQRIEFKVGLFILITSLLILASIGYVAYRKGVFSTVYTYTLSSQTGENLTEGMPVAVWGFTIGRVSSLELNDKGIVLIRIKIQVRPRQAADRFAPNPRPDCRSQRQTALPADDPGTDRIQ
jgi:phospholipid/cholesterol/gamma-HCH transport system substrate-binding protein